MKRIEKDGYGKLREPQSKRSEIFDTRILIEVRHVGPFDLVLGMIREPKLQAAPDGGEPQAAELLAAGGIYVSLLSPQIEQMSSARGIRFRFARVRRDLGDWNMLLARTSQENLKIHTEAEFPFTAQGIEQACRDGERGKRGQYLIVR